MLTQAFATSFRNTGTKILQFRTNSTITSVPSTNIEGLGDFLAKTIWTFNGAIASTFIDKDTVYAIVGASIGYSIALAPPIISTICLGGVIYDLCIKPRLND